MKLRRLELKSQEKTSMKRGILNITWLWLVLALVLPATAVMLFNAKPAAG